MTRKMRRPRQEAPKVWHNPDVVHPGGVRRGSPIVVAPTPEPPPSASSGVRARGGRIVARAPSVLDPRDLERERLLDRLRTAEGRSAITRAADELVRGGFTPAADDQIVFLQLLEHSDEARVREAIGRLDALLAEEPAKRFTVLESRLRRLEELAEDAETRDAARGLRRRVTGRDAGAP